MKSLTIAGLIAASAAGTLVLLAATPPSAPAQGRSPGWPGVQRVPVVTEWYSDIPWTQKLGTYRGNEIDAALVLPYEALPDDAKKYCMDNKLTTAEACMLEVGIANVLGVLRTDTPYNPQDAILQKNAKDYCGGTNPPCTEVKLELSSSWTRPTGALVPQTFGTEPDPGGNHFGGYVITDGSTYAPQMPWYLSHYCDSFFPANIRDVQDPVCYADYFSPMNDGFNPFAGEPWPNSGAPWSVFPAAPAPPTTSNHCKSGETKCTLAMAGFRLSKVLEKIEDSAFQYQKYNQFLLTWFNAASKNFPGDLVKDTRHFPWTGTEITWNGNSPSDTTTFRLYPRAVMNPFLGQFKFETPPGEKPNGPGCDIDVNGPTITGTCDNTGNQRAAAIGGLRYPGQCDLADLAGAAGGSQDKVERLRRCGLNYEFHHNGFLAQWPASFEQDLTRAGMNANQYGRTSFLFGGVPGLQLPVSFYKDPGDDSGLSVYERVYNASIFSLYLPVANFTDTKHAYTGRNYTDTEFYHTLLMSNHMEAKPEQFVEGIRGKVLWHNEYRTQKQYDVNGQPFNPTRTFAAAFDPQNAKVPFHNNTCDGCHVRNGSGVPIKPSKDPAGGTLDPALQEFMTAGPYNPVKVQDYTFTGQIQPMKLVFFDLKRKTEGLDASRYSEPLSFPPSFALVPLRPSRPRGGAGDDDRYYNNKIMNFYGDSFHVTKPSDYGYDWSYVAASPSRLVVTTDRFNFERNKKYIPQQITVGNFRTKGSCDPRQDLVPPPATSKPWPKTCADINGAAIGQAINVDREVGFMLLNGKRLGNSSAIEAIPNRAILGFRDDQIAALGANIAGELIWQAGSRDGVDGQVKKCATTNKSLEECYIGRFGWLGDRASLEDQVANAAFVEMNMTTSEGSKKLSTRGAPKFPLRYDHPNCGPADKRCVESTANRDLSEKDVGRMAEYARWVGNPTRSEFKVSLPEVIAGEKIFRQLKCDSCHVIKKIAISDPDDTMLTSGYRERLKTRVVTQDNIFPFLSYIGTDLLMHDMGYLSQTADASGTIRDADGVVIKGFENYVQKIRTPALKGLRFNRFVTESYKNTVNAGDPACDFLLHDGRACDAIEAAFLHDGPAIKKLGVIEGLSKLLLEDIRALRAFLYSL